jgi:hypothetical protein
MQAISTKQARQDAERERLRRLKPYRSAQRMKALRLYSVIGLGFFITGVITSCGFMFDGQFGLSIILGIVAYVEVFLFSGFLVYELKKIHAEAERIEQAWREAARESGTATDPPTFGGS